MMTLKKLGIAFAGVLGCAAVIGADLESYVPDAMPIVVQLNAVAAVQALDANLGKFPVDFQEDYREFRDQCAKLQLKHSQLFERILITAQAEDCYLALLQTTVPEEKLPALLVAFAETAEDAEMPPVKVVDGQKYYVLEAEADKDASMALPAAAAFTYLDKNVIAVIPWTDAGRALLKAPCGNNPQMKGLANSKIISAAFVVPEELRQAVQDPAQKEKTPAPIGGTVWIDMVGGGKSDVAAEINAEFPDKAGRDQLAAQGQMMLPLLIGAAFQDDAALAMDAINAFKFRTPSEKTLQLNVLLPEDLLNRIADYQQKEEAAEEAAEDAKDAKPASVVPAA